MIEKKVKTTVPIYAVGITFIVLGLFLPLYQFTYFLLCAAISAAVYATLYRFLPGKTILVEAPVKKADTGDKTADEIIMDARIKLKEIYSLGKTFQSSPISPQLDEINFYGNKIMDYMENNPDKTREIHQFTEYYLPTTLKLVNNYVKFKSQGAAGENINKAVVKIEDVMGTISRAYKNQYDNLFEDNSIDIVAEVNVLEKLIEAEGLTEGNDIRKGPDSERRDK